MPRTRVKKKYVYYQVMSAACRVVEPAFERFLIERSVEYSVYRYPSGVRVFRVEMAVSNSVVSQFKEPICPELPSLTHLFGSGHEPLGATLVGVSGIGDRSGKRDGKPRRRKRIRSSDSNGSSEDVTATSGNGHGSVRSRRKDSGANGAASGAADGRKHHESDDDRSARARTTDDIGSNGGSTRRRKRIRSSGGGGDTGGKTNGREAGEHREHAKPKRRRRKQ